MTEDNSTTTAQAFDTLDENLKLDPTARARAIRAHNEVTLDLTAQGTICDAFLQGSFRRKTMLAPLRDIDKVVIITWDAEDTGPGSARRAAEMVAAALRSIYPDAAVEIGKHCVKLQRPQDDFSFDAVPAIECDDDTGDVLIIDTDQDRWERSNTRALIKAVQERNGECDGQWVRQARMVKLFVRERLAGCIPGLHVEKYAFDAVKDDMPHDEAVAAILAKGAELLAPGISYSDPIGVDRIDDRLDPADRERARQDFERAAGEAGRAVQHARDGNDNAAIAIWHNLFGDDFPKPDERAALNDLGRGFGIATTVTRTAPVQPRETRAWRSR
jgi:hypothetical protein